MYYSFKIDRKWLRSAYKHGAYSAKIFDLAVDTFKPTLANPKKIEVYFEDENATIFTKFLKNKSISYTKKEIEDFDWSKSNRDFLVKINSSLRIVPPWQKKLKNDIVINPGMGFGTGHHETTAMILNYLSKCKNKKSFLDFGTGSGILGIYALKKGFQDITFCDIDTDALDNCKENILLNFNKQFFSKRFLLLTTPNRLTTRKYDVIAANILLRPLIKNRKFLINSLNPNGILILSGILLTQLDKLQSAFPLEKVSITKKNEWAMLVLKK